ncbi:MAG: BatD family protein [Candidatus Brocadiaceae bacterium]
MKRFISISIFIMIIIISGYREKTFAEDIRLSATVDRNVITINDQLQLTLTIHGTHDTLPPSFPTIDGFTLLYGPKISAETRVVNNTVSVSKGYTYVLQPNAKGKFTIGPSTVEYKGKTYSSQPITVEVAHAKTTTEAQPPDIDKLIFVELGTDKSEAYLYEQVILSFKFYFQKRLPISDIDYVAPAIKNFMEEKLGEQRQYEEVRDGIMYNVLELRSALFPIVSGDLVISQAILKCNLILQQRRNRQNTSFDNFFDDSFFDEFFNRGQKIYPVEKTTRSIVLKVKPLPEQGKPKYFRGAVGTFNMEVSTKSQEVKTGDPVTLSMSIYGEGNIQTISEPVLVLNNESDFKLYPAESVTQITNREESIRGRKVFDKVIEPQKATLKSTPEIVFSFFDPREGQYKTITKEPIPIVVETGEQEMPIQLTQSPMNMVSKQQAQLITQDILPIMTNLSSLRNQGDNIFKNPILLACLSIPAVTVLASFFITQQKKRLQTDVEYARKRRAHSAAKKKLVFVQSALSGDSPAEFYNFLSRAMADYLADKCNVSAASATGDSIGHLLRHQEVNEDIIAEITHFINDLDYRRFSKDAGTGEEMRHSLDLAEQLITKLERQLS